MLNLMVRDGALHPQHFSDTALLVNVHFDSFKDYAIAVGEEAAGDDEYTSWFPILTDEERAGIAAGGSVFKNCYVENAMPASGVMASDTNQSKEN